MGKHVWYKFVMVCCVCSLLGSGCAWRRKPDPGIADGLGPDDTVDIIGVGGHVPDLVERFEDGTRVTGVEFRNVEFAYDSFQITDSEIPKVEAVGDYMSSNADVRLVAEGHCDERGSNEYNMSLGEHRGLAVRAYLVGLGIDGSRIQTRSFGRKSLSIPATTKPHGD